MPLRQPRMPPFAVDWPKRSLTREATTCRNSQRFGWQLVVMEIQLWQPSSLLSYDTQIHSEVLTETSTASLWRCQKVSL